LKHSVLFDLYNSQSKLTEVISANNSKGACLCKRDAVRFLWHRAGRFK